MKHYKCMKKNCFYGRGVPFYLKKCLLIMRLCLFFMLVLQIGVSASGYTQQRVSLSMQDVTLEHVLKELKKQTGLRFFYSVEKVRPEQKKVVNIENDVLENALRSVLMGTGLTFTIMNDVVVIKDEVVSTADSLQKRQQLLKGIVKDKAGEPLPGVTILIEGTTIGCATDIDGKYSLTLPGEVKGVVLVFRFVGMETKKVSMDEVKDKEILQGKKEFVVVLEEQTENLDDVVVTGIFRRSKELATGASVTVTGEQLKMVGNQNILQSLRTLDPSFKIVENNLNGSDPNALPEIEVRGANGIPDLDANYKGNPNQPLFILDGFEVSLQRVVDLDPNRVESISILKDASAAALYGSRSANGVIVIETKAPEIGRLRLSYNGDYAVVMPDLTDYDLLNAREALELQKDAGHFEGRSLSNDIEMKEYYNRMLKNVMEGVDTYWLSKPLRTAFEHRHNFELSGGDKVIRYGINFSVRMTPGVMKGSSHNNYMGGVFLQYRKGGLLFKNDLQITANESKNSPYGEFSQYVSLNPYVRPYDGQGRPVKLFDDKYPDFLEGSQFNKNPLYNATLHSVDEEKYTDFTNNFSIEWTISEKLTLTGRFSLTKQFTSSDLFYSASHTMFEELGDPINSPDEFLRRGKASFSNGESFSILGDLNLRYGQSFGKHNIYAVVGLNASQSKNHDKTVDVEGFPNDNMSSIAFAKQYYKDSRPEATYGIQRLAGILGTFNYSYDRRYLFDFSLKVDGSSNFGSNNRFAPIWSLGAGWNIHNESWMEKMAAISILKLRCSYGITASQNFAPFQATSMYSYETGRHYAGLIPAWLKGIGNKDLKWQTTHVLNFGLELGFVDSRYMINIDYYQRRTDNLLADVTIATSTGFSSYKENIGETENRGFEATVKAMFIKRPQDQIYWSVNVSAAHNRNRITKISNFMKKRNEEVIKKAEEENQSAPVILYEEGRSLTDIYAVRSLGIDPATGNELYLTKQGLTTFTYNSFDQVAVGNTRPDLEGIIGTSLTYKNLTFSANFRYKIGGQIYNSTLVDRVENADLYGNVDRRIYDDRWRKEGDQSLYKSIFDKTTTRPTSRFVQDENVFTCESVSLGYDIKHKGILRTLGMERLRVNAYMNDIMRLSTVRQERGINYPFANRIAFSLSATF